MSTTTKARPLPIQEQQSHSWPFGAIAEIIDTSLEGATKLSILMENKNSRLLLSFTDDGAGMNKEELSTKLSKTDGQNGNSFKSVVMQLAKEALVITRSTDRASIGLLSETCNSETGAVPIIEYELPGLKRVGGPKSKKSSDIIKEKGPFNDVKKEIRDFTTTGTKITLYNLKTLENGETELQFLSDSKDIIMRSKETSGGYKPTLREYCSILYLHPRKKIVIQGHDVKPKYIAGSLNKTVKYTYKLPDKGKTDGSPTDTVGDNISKVLMIFGYTCEEGPSKDYGVLMYHKNRLIKAYEKFGQQKKNTGRGVDVVGVVEVDMLTPTHNKQDFMDDEQYKSIKEGLLRNLNRYLTDTKGQIEEGVKKLPDWLWVHCDKCFKWRRLPQGTEESSLPELWYCHMNPDKLYNGCAIAEEFDLAGSGKPKRTSAQTKKRLEGSSNILDSTLPTSSGSTSTTPLPTSSSSLVTHVSPVTQVSVTKQPTKRKSYQNATNDQPEISSTSVSGDDDAPQPKQALLDTKIHPQEAAKNILASIMERKKEQDLTKPTTSSNALPTAQNWITNSGNSMKSKDASIQTDILTSFHHKVHEVLKLLTEKNPGNVEDIEAVVDSVLEGYRP